MNYTQIFQGKLVGMVIRGTPHWDGIAFLRGGKEQGFKFYFAISGNIAAAAIKSKFHYDSETPNLTKIGIVPATFPRIRE